MLLLCYLIGLTYVAKQETLGRRAQSLAARISRLAAGIRRARAGQWRLLQPFCSSPSRRGSCIALHFLWRRRPGDVPRAVVSLIAGISLLDAVFIAAFGNAPLAGFAVAAFVLTLALQRVVAGT